MPENKNCGNTPGERIRWARFETGLDIVDVARKAGLCPGTISRIENGRAQTVEIETLRKLAPILKQTIAFLGCFDLLPESTLAERIRKARLIHGLTKSELAAKIGTNEKTVRLWERGRCSPTEKSMKILVPYLKNLKLH
ncbi:helix-turn-helix domain-containing protein [Lucifera butyrica]|uniref:helix-turn-helix domain-containing protein n=1 Tax=Lucifera butyrica TaxID=1351585 RepID=UPI001403CD18|nr:helix-turn-helix domain-containing protein [Lucifera butyrica]